MTSPFDHVLRTLAACALLGAVPLGAAAQTVQTPPPQPSPASADGTLPAGGHFKECHGYVRHVSDLNIKVHCIDGDASDQSFLYYPKFTSIKDGKSVQTKDLTPDTPVHIYYTQSLGVKKAYKIYLADPSGNGAYGFRT